MFRAHRADRRIPPAAFRRRRPFRRRLRIEGRDARASRPDPLGERALRIELELQLAGEIEMLEQFVLADIGRDHLSNLTALRRCQSPKPSAPALFEMTVRSFTPDAWISGIRLSGLPNQSKAAGHDRHPIAKEAFERGPRRLVDLVHSEPNIVWLCSRMN